MAEEEEKKGFTIRDRRAATQSEQRAGEEKEQKERKTPEGGKESPGAGPARPLPEIDFPAFIFSLRTSALLHLGEIPDPVTQKQEKDLPLAKQTIDILGMLKEKTKGNLTPEEEKILESILADLRWRYIREAKE